MFLMLKSTPAPKKYTPPVVAVVAVVIDMSYGLGLDIKEMLALFSIKAGHSAESLTPLFLDCCSFLM